MFRFVSEVGSFVAKVISPKPADPTNGSGLDSALSSSKHEGRNDNVTAESPKRLAKSPIRTPKNKCGESPPRLRGAQKTPKRARGDAAKLVKVGSPETPVSQTRRQGQIEIGGETSKSRKVLDRKGAVSEKSNLESPEKQMEVGRVWKRKVLTKKEAHSQPKPSEAQKKRTSVSSRRRLSGAKRKAEVLQPAEAPRKKRPKSAGKEAPGKECVGKRIKVLWEKGVVPGVNRNTWFVGKVTSYNPRKKLHGIQYDDGDFEEEDFGPTSSTKFEILN